MKRVHGREQGCVVGARPISIGGGRVVEGILGVRVVDSHETQCARPVEAHHIVGCDTARFKAGEKLLAEEVGRDGADERRFDPKSSKSTGNVVWRATNEVSPTR